MNRNAAIIKIFCCLFFSLASFSIIAEDRVEYYLEPPKITLQQLGTNSFNSQLITPSSNILNFGFQDNAVWLRVTISKNSRDRYFQIEASSLQFVEFYAPNNTGGYSKRSFKEKSGGRSNIIEHRTLLFELNQNQQPETHYFIKLKGNGNLFLKYFFLSKQEFISKSNIDYLTIGIYLGLMLFLAIYNFIQYSLTSRKSYLYFVFFVLSLSLNFAYESGVWGQYVIGSQFFLSGFFQIVFAGLVLLSAQAVTWKILELKDYAPRLELIVKGVFLLTLAQMVFSIVTGLSFFNVLGRYLEIGIPAFLLYISIFIALGGNSSAKWMTIAWSVFFISLIISVSIDSGLMPNDLISAFGSTSGSAVTALLISWTLSIKAFKETEAFYSGHMDKGGSLSREIRELKSIVDQNEKEIKKYLDLIEDKDNEIEYNLKRLREQSIYDKLTKLLNYSSFILQFNRFYHDASRYHYPVAVVLIDMDQFKQINETYGLDIGNEILKDVADILQQDCRNTDLIARYGDDEFIFLMTHAIKENAVIKSEQIIQKIRSIRVKNHSDLAVSASIGITMMGSGGGGFSHDTRSILEEAKKALNMAKGEGGGQVRVFVKVDD